MIKQLVMAALLSAAAISPASWAGTQSVEINNVSVNNKQTWLKVKGELKGFGKNTPLTLRDADNLDVIFHSEIVKNKRFNTKVQIEDLIYVPCKIAAVANNNTTLIDSADVTDVSSCGGYSATLSGLVTDEPIPYASVSVTVNGNTFTTTADENGAYSLTILTTTIETLVKIESSAFDAQTGDEINFVNLLRNE